MTSLFSTSQVYSSCFVSQLNPVSKLAVSFPLMLIQINHLQRKLMQVCTHSFTETGQRGKAKQVASNHLQQRQRNQNCTLLQPQHYCIHPANSQPNHLLKPQLIPDLEKWSSQTYWTTQLQPEYTDAFSQPGNYVASELNGHIFKLSIRTAVDHLLDITNNSHLQRILTHPFCAPVPQTCTNGLTHVDPEGLHGILSLHSVITVPISTYVA
jgi:hypothetical protein